MTKKEGFPYFCQQAVNCYMSKTSTERNVAQELRHVHMALDSWAVKQVSKHLLKRRSLSTSGPRFEVLACQQDHKHRVVVNYAAFFCAVMK